MQIRDSGFCWDDDFEKTIDFDSEPDELLSLGQVDLSVEASKNLDFANGNRNRHQHHLPSARLHTAALVVMRNPLGASFSTAVSKRTSSNP